MILLLLVLAPFAAPPVSPDSVAPRAMQIYGPDDPQREMKAAIEAMMGIYLVDPPRRHPSERVVIQGGRVRFDVWQPIGRNTDAELKTRAVKWLLFGRTSFSSGARGIFSEYPRVVEVMLVFHEVNRPDTKKRRRTQQTETLARYLILKLSRAKFSRLEPEPFRECVSGGDCEALFVSGFDANRYDRKYVAARQKEAEE